LSLKMRATTRQDSSPSPPPGPDILTRHDCSKRIAKRRKA
jgi:hypothetical protein